MTIHLCFHGVGTCSVEREPGESKYWITRDLFERVLDELHGRRDVALSFDDGNRSDVDIAVPALRERGLRATFFPLAGRFDERGSLSPADLHDLREAGMGIGTHGWHHVAWRRLSEAEARCEFIDARARIEEASGVRVSCAALPLGQYDRTTLRQLKASGYQKVYSSDRFRSGASSWLQARYSLMATDTIESVRKILRPYPGVHEARNVLASAIKRLR